MGHCGDRTRVQPRNPALRADVLPTELNDHLADLSSDKRNEPSRHYLSHRPYLHITFHNETLYIIEKFGHIDPTDIIYMLLFLRHLSRELVFESTPVVTRKVC